MKTVLLTGHKDAEIGFRLAGIQSQMFENSEGVLSAIKLHILNPNIGLVLITDDIADAIYDDIMQLKLSAKDTMILTIPKPGAPFVDRMGSYIGESIGIKYE